MAFVVYDSTPIRVLNSEYNPVVTPDNTPPTITLGGANPATVQVGSPFVDSYTAVDNNGANLTGAVVVTGQVDTTQIGSYTLVYKATGRAGTSTTTARLIYVVDTLPPILTLEGPNPQFIEQGAPYVELPYTAIDLYDGPLTADVIVAGTVNTAVPGSYIIQYLVLDSSGNRAQAVRTVIVVATGTEIPGGGDGDGDGGNGNGNGDSRYPQIVLHGDADMTISAGTVFAEPGFEASDSANGNLTSRVIRHGSVDTNAAGSYTLVYTVANSLGFIGTATRRVRVVGNSLSAGPASCAPSVGYSWGGNDGTS